MKSTWVILAAFALTSCSSIRMKYDADIETQGKDAKYTFEKSYDVGSYPALCGLTAIFFGGACWFYLVMPTTTQQDVATSDAKLKLEKTLGHKPYKVVGERAFSTGFKDAAEESKLTYVTN